MKYPQTVLPSANVLLDSTSIFPDKAPASVFAINKSALHRKYQSVSPECIRCACSTRLGFPPQTILPVTDGKGSCLYCVESDDGRRFAMKIGIFADHHSLCHELLFTTIVAFHTKHIPVQEIYTVDVSGELVPWPYSISKWLPGTSIINCVSAGYSNGSEPIFEQLGYIVSQIHVIGLQMTGLGYVTGACAHDFLLTKEIPVPLHGEDGTMEERYVRPASEAASYLFQKSVIGRHDHDSIMMLLADDIPENGEIVFQHGDMSMGNFLTAENVITGVLDGSGMIGFRLDELASVFIFLHALEFHFPHFSARKAFTGFIRGYNREYEKEVSQRYFIFFLVTNVLKHMAVLMKSGRHKHITEYVNFLRRYLERS